jgi:hypothetical protein
MTTQKTLQNVGSLLTVALFVLVTRVVGAQPPSSEGLARQDSGVSMKSYVTGGVTGTVFGLGIGHAVVGEYKSTGWIFTVGEAAALGVFIGGLASADETRIDGEDKLQASTAEKIMIVAGGLVYLGLRVWEVIDVWTRPELAPDRAGHAAEPQSLAKLPRLMVLPLATDSGPAVGATLRF